MRSPRALLAAAAGVVLATAGLASPAPAQATGTSFAPDGVLFFPSVAGLMPLLKAPHFCSASVVHSAGHDLVVTAAHCLYGNGATIQFAPGFADGKEPYGVWTATRLYVEPAWKSGQSPTADVAFLRIAPLRNRQVEDVVGARPLGLPVPGASVTLSGFPLSSNTPTVCTNTLRLTAGYPTIDCAGGVVDGVSGGAWVQNGSVVGVLGGYEQGGCTAQVGYSAPFNAATLGLLARAESATAGDTVAPGFFANSCS